MRGEQSSCLALIDIVSLPERAFEVGIFQQNFAPVRESSKDETKDRQDMTRHNGAA